ncbi:Ankyrin repeat-containing protein BDA1 [Glycine max]|nr:Ankyrin repeat-containing protein BDA1 [Glycine max]
MNTTREDRSRVNLAAQEGDIDGLYTVIQENPHLGGLGELPHKGARDLERTTLNWEDEEGNTILHISSRENNLQALQLLLKTKVDLKAKNLENSTALDVVTSAEIRNALVKAGAKQGSSVTNAPTLADKLRWNITLMGKITIFVLRIRSDITEDQRQAFLIVAALIATATYQSALSPPGGVFQANAGNNNNNNVNITSLNSTTIATQGINVGTSVISEGDFLTLSIFNSLSLLTSTVTMYILTPSGIVGTILFTPMFWFAYCYLYSIRVISPTNATKYFNLIMLCLFFFLYSGVWWTFSIVYKRLKCHEKKRDIGTRNSTGRNIW